VTTAPVLRVEDLHVWFEIDGGELHAVQGVGFDLHAGERMGLVGESGCGKTTTILALMGLLPSSASVALANFERAVICSLLPCVTASSASPPWYSSLNTRLATSTCASTVG